jgi:transcriptional regulator with XRE-family HTH domain
MEAKKFLKSLGLGRTTFGSVLRNIRFRDDLTQVEMANILGISKAKLCDLEKGRRQVSLLKAIEFAKALKDSPDYFVKVIIDDQLHEAGLKFEVELKSA